MCKVYYIYISSPLLAAVLVGLVEDVYEISEIEGYLEVCVYLYNHTERDVTVSLFSVPSTATGEHITM